MIENTGLILEGGGFRGIYSAGIIDVLLDENIEFPYVIGVSMGACNGANYISKQRGRNLRVPYTYINDNRYISFSNYIKTGGLFGMDFIFNDIPHKIDLFDYDTFNKSTQKFIIVATDCETGEPIYFEKNEIKDLCEVLKATTSLPFISKMVDIENNLYLDGGISDSIPIKKAFDDGNDKLVILLTRPKEYRKDPVNLRFFGKFKYKKHPKVLERVKDRYIKYNETLDYIEKLEEQGKAFVFRPKEPLNMGRVERNKEKLKSVYDLGYKDGLEYKNQLLDFLNS